MKVYCVTSVWEKLFNESNDMITYYLHYDELKEDYYWMKYPYYPELVYLSKKKGQKKKDIIKELDPYLFKQSFIKLSDEKLSDPDFFLHFDLSKIKLGKKKTMFFIDDFED